MLAAERRKSGRETAETDAAEPVAASDPEEAAWVRDALERLESTEREILLLREYEQLSYEEIAGLLQLRLNTVRSRLFRARMALRDLLARAPQA